MSGYEFLAGNPRFAFAALFVVCLTVWATVAVLVGARKVATDPTGPKGGRA